jgi:CMP-N-acetylneuraminate monooxygenase
MSLDGDIFSFGKQLKNQQKKIIQKISKPSNSDFFQLEDVIVGNRNGKWVAYDRICDHNGGTLNIDSNKLSATCPLHKWTLKLAEGEYENRCRKEPLLVEENPDFLEVHRVSEEFDYIDTSQLIDVKIEMQFNAHASVTAILDDVKITTDPWFVGSCFATGWWHINPPSQEAIQRLIDSNFIYISHNHPDHLHIPTLEKYVAKDVAIIIPNFESKSVESILKKLGYFNLIVADFLREINIKTNNGYFKVVVVKSGDDRDDSSLILATKQNKLFFGVDTNMPNRWILPSVDILFTPFAGGASGFPARIENFSIDEKNEITKKNRLSILHSHVKNLCNATTPRFVIPYAGYFTESYRDSDVKKINIKNNPNDLIQFIQTSFPDIVGIDPIINPHISIFGEDFKIHDVTEFPAHFIDEEYVNNEISEFSMKSLSVDDDFLGLVGEAFLKSSYVDDLIIVIIPSSNLIDEATSSALIVDFSSSNRSYQLLQINNFSNEVILGAINNPNKNNIEILKIRSDSFNGAIRRGLPLEDLSIGFQIKMFRVPNVYNFKFWDHFTNRELIKV